MRDFVSQVFYDFMTMLRISVLKIFLAFALGAHALSNCRRHRHIVALPIAALSDFILRATLPYLRRKVQ